MPIHFQSNNLIVIKGKPTDESVNREIEDHLERFRLRGITKEGEETFYYLTSREVG
jgi:hypothetical protein